MLPHPPTQRDDDDDLPLVPTGVAPNAKLQRWTDLVVALLGRTYPASFDELAGDVPEYAAARHTIEAEPDEKRRATMEASLKRTFERDKQELLDFGVPLESITDEEGNALGSYRLRRGDFYMPYLCLALPDGVSRPAPVSKWPYRNLQSLAFTPDELQAVVDAAALVRGLGDRLLAADADGALRKLAVDLPIDGAASLDEPHVVLPLTRPDAEVFDALGDALARRKLASFTYHAMSTDRTERREVESYGLFFLSGHWYLAACDRPRRALRNFRLSRISGVEVNTKRSQSPDYEIPATFRLREHAQSRHAWELGDDEPVDAVVRFTGWSGPTMAAARLGAASPDDERVRTFPVRRVDTFARWLLSFVGEATPLSPPDLVARYRAEASDAAARYGTGADAAAEARMLASPSAPSARSVAAARQAWQPAGAAAQLRRILDMMPRLADGEEHVISDLAREIGADVATLRRDVFSVTARYDAPTQGFAEGLRAFIAPDRVSTESAQLARPMRLTVPELCALELGLSVLRARRPPDEHAVLVSARERLRDVIAKLPGDAIPDGLHGVSLGERVSTDLLATIRRAIRARRKLRLVYRKSGASAGTTYTIAPHGAHASAGTLYVVAYGDHADGVRLFRTDRVESIELLDEHFERRPDFSHEAVLRQLGRPFVTEGSTAAMRVRYSPRVARWIAEREGRALDADGALVMEHPLADPEWGMRHVLQYGGEAEVLAPATLREQLRDRLDAMIRSVS